MRASSAARRMSIGSVIVAPTPDRRAVDRGDHRLRALEDPQRELAAVVAPRARTASRLRESKVSPPLARSAPAQKPRPAPVTMIARTSSSASASIERRAQLRAHLRRPRVQPLGPVERDREHAVGHLGGDLLEVHARAHPLQRSGRASSPLATGAQLALVRAATGQASAPQRAASASASREPRPAPSA